ncbi:MAG: DUF998 domain-containing protein [Hyphomicrobiales bacterium]|nr:DUF998 domain-containing protein [Hyphomicrobiales bacterium]
MQVTIYAAAALAYLAQLALFLALNIRGRYSLVSHAVSDYGIGPSRRLFTIYGLIGIIAAAALGAAVLMDGRFPARGGIYLLAMAALRLGVLAFPTDLEGERLTGAGKLHYLFAIASFALAYMTIDVLNPAALSIVADWASPVLAGLYWIVAASLAGVVICLVPALRRIFGLVERVFLVSVLLWSAVFALAAA